MSELKRIENKYFRDSEFYRIKFHDGDEYSKKSLEEIIRFIPYLKQYDRPDMYAKIGDSVFALEHFEFDAAEYIQRGGSRQRKEEARIDKEFNIEVQNREEKTIYKHDEIQAKPCVANYRDNFIRNFSTHCKKIPDYITRLKDDRIITTGSDVIMGFFIEDATVLGNIYFDDEDQSRFLSALYTDFFWNSIEANKEGLDCIFFGFFDGGKDIVYYVDLKTTYDYRSHLIKLTEKNFLSRDPKVVSFSLSISSSEE